MRKAWKTGDDQQMGPQVMSGCITMVTMVANWQGLGYANTEWPCHVDHAVPSPPPHPYVPESDEAIANGQRPYTPVRL